MLRTNYNYKNTCFAIIHHTRDRLCEVTMVNCDLPYYLLEFSYIINHIT